MIDLEMANQRVQQLEGQLQQCQIIIWDSCQECQNQDCDHCRWLGDALAAFHRGIGEIRPTFIDRLIDAQQELAAARLAGRDQWVVAHGDNCCWEDECKFRGRECQWPLPAALARGGGEG